MGYGRRRREVASIPADPNKIFEVTMSTYIRVDYKGDELLEKGMATLVLMMLHHILWCCLLITRAYQWTQNIVLLAVNILGQMWGILKVNISLQTNCRGFTLFSQPHTGIVV
jgi:hypothetical protein